MNAKDVRKIMRGTTRGLRDASDVARLFDVSVSSNPSKSMYAIMDGDYEGVKIYFYEPIPYLSVFDTGALYALFMLDKKVRDFGSYAKNDIFKNIKWVFVVHRRPTWEYEETLVVDDER